MRRTVLLVVLDGWGIGKENESNPIYMVKPETFSFLKENFPMTSLQASGISVGLPWGETGNSEVGHLTIGAGKVLYQYYPRITIAIRNGSFFENPALKGAFLHARKNNSAVNFVGLLSKGNVHASIEHLLALVEMARAEKINFKMHLFSDGKDNRPYSLEEFLKELPVENLSSLVGRYYAMDREQNWSLTARAYELITGGGGQPFEQSSNLSATIGAHYSKGSNEEFLPPIRLGEGIKDGESVIFFNYREDSIRQISESFILKNFSKFPTKKFENLYLTTMSRYEERFDVPVAYPPEDVKEPLGKILGENQKTQLRIAETYKYAHITYFFNGYREPPFENEYRVLIPSLNAPHIEEHPQMMASAITDRVIQAVENQSFDFILANYANPDTIAHTGNYNASLEAVRVVDKEIGRLVKSVLSSQTILMITSDHGNLEEVADPMTGHPETQHDPSPVPLHLVAEEFRGRKFTNYQNLAQTVGILSDVAPTILELMGLPKPEEMTGHSLLHDLII